MGWLAHLPNWCAYNIKVIVDANLNPHFANEKLKIFIIASTSKS